jgi:hypothetical protein
MRVDARARGATTRSSVPPPPAAAEGDRDAHSESRLRGNACTIERTPKRMKMRLQMLKAKPAGVTSTGNKLETAPMEGVKNPGPVTALAKMNNA